MVLRTKTVDTLNTITSHTGRGTDVEQRELLTIKLKMKQCDVEKIFNHVH